MSRDKYKSLSKDHRRSPSLGDKSKFLPFHELSESPLNFKIDTCTEALDVAQTLVVWFRVFPEVRVSLR